MMKRIVFTSTIALIAMTTSASAVAPGVDITSSRYTIGLVGYVPVICRASVDAQMIGTQEGLSGLGSLNEFCNSPNGYRVYADHSPSLADAKLVVDGVEVPLGDEGATMVSSSEHAAIASHDMSVELPAGVDGGSLSFRIEPR